MIQIAKKPTAEYRVRLHCDDGRVHEIGGFKTADEARAYYERSCNGTWGYEVVAPSTA